MALVPAQSFYPTTLADGGEVVMCDLTKLKIYLLCKLEYSQTEADRIVLELSQLLMNVDRRDVLFSMINRDRGYSYEFVKVILQTLNPVDKLLFIKKQVGDSAGLFAVACKNSSPSVVMTGLGHDN